MDNLGVSNDVEFPPLDVLEITNIARVIERVRPDELYNLAAQSFVSASFEQPILTTEVDAVGAVRILECLRSAQPWCRFYQASTSEKFGKAQDVPQSEGTPFYPRSPYGAAKLYAHWITVNDREAYGLHTTSGILSNHESLLRGPEFVSGRITLGLAQIRHGRAEPIRLGNLDAERDWGFTGDFVNGMWLMLQQSEGDEYVLATGRTHSVRDFVESAAAAAGLDLGWRGKAEKTDPTKARNKFGWQPEVSFEQLVEMMVRADMARVAAKP